MIRLITLLLATALLAPAAYAQAPHALNTRPQIVAEEEPLSAAHAIIARGAATPDTTSPWRYFPLEVGNAWEYTRHPTGLPDIDLGRRRIDIEKDTIIGGINYVVYSSRYYDESGMLVQGPTRNPIRFDSSSAFIMEPFMGEERIFRETPCPFDADFDSIAQCFENGIDYFVGGGYDLGLLSFGDVSLVVTFKSYTDEDFNSTVSYADDYGRYASVQDQGSTQLLDYVRVRDEEYGTPIYPLVVDEITEHCPEAYKLTASPNPFNDNILVKFNLVESDYIILEIFDIQGRCVYRHIAGMRPAGPQFLDIHDFSASVGVYLMRIRGNNGASAVLPVVRAVMPGIGGG